MFKVDFKFRSNEWSITDFETKEKAEIFANAIDSAINKWGDIKKDSKVDENELLIFEILEM